MNKQCKETVYIRDTYRYSGRGRSGFTMHYRRQQCSRKAKGDTGYCWQHAWKAAAERRGAGSEEGEHG